MQSASLRVNYSGHCFRNWEQTGKSKIEVRLPQRTAESTTPVATTALTPSGKESPGLHAGGPGSAHGVNSTLIPCHLVARVWQMLMAALRRVRHP